MFVGEVASLCGPANWSVFIRVL